MTHITCWEPSFDVYKGYIGPRLALFSVDLAAADHAPVSDHGVRVTFTAQRPQSAAKRSPAGEVDAIYALEDLLLIHSKKHNAIYVGRWTCDGETTLIFYATSDSAQALVDELNQVRPSSHPTCEVKLEDDATWAQYFDFLLPDPYEYQSMMNRHLLETMVQCGDKLSVARTVDHGALFPKRSLACTAAAQLTKAGFTVSEPVRRWTGEDNVRDEFPWLLTFHREEKGLSIESVDHFCSEVLDVVLACDGEYDGWGAPIQGEQLEPVFDEAVGS